MYWRILHFLKRLEPWRFKRERPKVKVNRVTEPYVWWLSVMKANDFSFSSVLKFVWVNLWIAITRYIVSRGGGQSSRDLDGIDTLSQATQPGSFGTKLNQFHHHYFWEGGNGRRPLLGVWILNQGHKTNNLIESVKWNLLPNYLLASQSCSVWPENIVTLFIFYDLKIMRKRRGKF